MKRFTGWVGPGAVAALALVGVAGCGAGSDSPETQLPSHVRVSLVDATIGIGTMDGEQWDGPGQVPEELMRSIPGVLARRNPYVAVGSFLASLGINSIEKPEPTGWAELLNGAAPVTRVDLKSTKEDTLTPQWQDAQGRAPSFGRVPLNASTRIRVHIEDADVDANDPIGLCELNYMDLAAALQAQQVHHVNVAEQTHKQLLFMGISVIPD